MSTSQKKPPRKRRQCGTVAGGRMHSKRGEQQCDACRAARREYQRAYNAGEDLRKFRTPKRESVRARMQREADRWMAVSDEELAALARQAEEDYQRQLSRETAERPGRA